MLFATILDSSLFASQPDSFILIVLLYNFICKLVHFKFISLQYHEHQIGSRTKEKTRVLLEGYLYCLYYNLYYTYFYTRHIQKSRTHVNGSLTSIIVYYMHLLDTISNINNVIQIYWLFSLRNVVQSHVPIIYPHYIA